MRLLPILVNLRHPATLPGMSASRGKSGSTKSLGYSWREAFNSKASAQYIFHCRSVAVRMAKYMPSNPRVMQRLDATYQGAIERPLCDPIADVRDGGLEWPVWVDLRH
jgi:hypothetical protein